MRKARLLRTSAFRHSLASALVFGLIAAVGVGFIYWSTDSFIEQQTDARLRLESDVLIDRYKRTSLPALVQAIAQRSGADGREQIFFYFLEGPDNRRLAGQIPAWPSNIGHQQHSTTLLLGELFDVPQAKANTRVRVLATPLTGDYRLLLGRDLSEEEKLLAHTWRIVWAVIAAIFLSALAISTWLGLRSLRRIDTISTTAGEIMAGDFSRRIPVSERGNEFDDLGRRLNAMLDQTEQLMAAMRQVSDNIAHDLRSPLTRLRNRLEVTLLEARNEAEYREVLAEGVEDADALIKTFNALLSIARAEAGTKANDRQKLDLNAMLEDMEELYGAAAEDNQQVFTLDISETLQFMANRHLLAQALSNLLDNALKFTPAGGKISLTAARTAGEIKISVADTGPGIPEYESERVLRRFVRLDTARATPGSGLGLSLVKAVADLHGGRIELSDNNPGLRVSLYLPEL